MVNVDMRRVLFTIMIIAVLSLTVLAQDVQPPPSHQVILSWNPATNAATCRPPCTVNYIILRSTITLQEVPVAKVDGNITTFTDTVPPSTIGPVTYFYQVRTTFSSQGFHIISNQATPELSVTFAASSVPSFPPEITSRPLPPQNLTVTSVP